MMGFSLHSLDFPVLKGTGGLLLFDHQSELAKLPSENPCVRCGKCVDTCPMFLEPTSFSKQSNVVIGRQLWPATLVPVSNAAPAPITARPISPLSSISAWANSLSLLTASAVITLTIKISILCTYRKEDSYGTGQSSCAFSHYIVIAIYPLRQYYQRRYARCFTITSASSGAAVYFFGWPALSVILTCCLSAVICEALCQKLMQRPITVGDGSALLTGLLLAFCLPPELSLGLAAFGSFCAVVIGKQVFGGLGSNIFNPAHLGRAILLASFPAQMTTWTMPWNTAAAEAVTKATPYTDAVSSATPLAALRLAESAWQRGLNVDLPSLSALFWGNVGGSLGETCVPALLLGGIYLLWRGHIDWRIPAGYIGTVVVITAIYGWLREYPTWFAIYHLLSGG